MKRWKDPTDRILIKDPRGRWPQYLMKKRTSTTKGIKGWKSEQPLLKDERTTSEIYRKTIGLEFCAAISRDFQRITER
jgi:hypothetical protein